MYIGRIPSISPVSPNIDPLLVHIGRLVQLSYGIAELIAPSTPRTYKFYNSTFKNTKYLLSSFSLHFIFSTDTDERIS